MGAELRYFPGQGNPLHCFMALYVGEGLEKGQCHYLAAGGLLSTCSATSLFTHFLDMTGAPLAVAVVLVPRVGDFANVVGLFGPFKWTLLRDWQFLPLLQPPLVFTARSYEVLFPGAGILGYMVWLSAGIAHFTGIRPNFLSTNCECGG